jgi:hypothetical protein
MSFRKALFLLAVFAPPAALAAPARGTGDEANAKVMTISTRDRPPAISA